MAEPIIPINQQDSFPILSVVGAQSADDVRILGGTVTKYWGPATTGVSGIPVTTDPAGPLSRASRYLNLEGCSVIGALISRFNAGAGGALPALQLWMQYRLDKATVMPTSNALGGGSINLDQCGMVAVHSGLLAFAATPGGLAGTEYALITWGPSTDVGISPPEISPTTLFSDVRFFISFSTNPVAAANLFSLSIW